MYTYIGLPLEEITPKFADPCKLAKENVEQLRHGMSLYR